MYSLFAAKRRNFGVSRAARSINLKNARSILLAITFLNHSSAAAQSVFSKADVGVLSGRTLAKLNNKSYYIFKTVELGDEIGCFTWGCNRVGAEGLVGKRVVVVGGFTTTGVNSGYKKEILQLFPERSTEYFTSGIHATPILRFDVIGAKVIADQQNKFKCGLDIVSYCTSVVWGTIRYSKERPTIKGFVHSDYYYLQLDGINLYAKYDLFSAMTDGARMGFNGAISLITQSGFDLK